MFLRRTQQLELIHNGEKFFFVTSHWKKLLLSSMTSVLRKRRFFLNTRSIQHESSLVITNNSRSWSKKLVKLHFIELEQTWKRPNKSVVPFLTWSHKRDQHNNFLHKVLNKLYTPIFFQETVHWWVKTKQRFFDSQQNSGGNYDDKNFWRWLRQNQLLSTFTISPSLKKKPMNFSLFKELIRFSTPSKPIHILTFCVFCITKDLVLRYLFFCYSFHFWKLIWSVEFEL